MQRPLRKHCAKDYSRRRCPWESLQLPRHGGCKYATLALFSAAAADGKRFLRQPLQRQSSCTNTTWILHASGCTQNLGQLGYICTGWRLSFHQHSSGIRWHGLGSTGLYDAEAADASGTRQRLRLHGRHADHCWAHGATTRSCASEECLGKFHSEYDSANHRRCSVAKVGGTDFRTVWQQVLRCGTQPHWCANTQLLADEHTAANGGQLPVPACFISTGLLRGFTRPGRQLGLRPSAGSDKGGQRV